MARTRIRRRHFTASRLRRAGNITTAEQLHGKELSYNNINDANAALAIVKEFNEPAVVAVKHMNPCGVGIGSDIMKLTKKHTRLTRPPSSAASWRRTVRSVRIQRQLLDEIFLEIIIAPDFTPEALDILTRKRKTSVC